MFRSIFTKTLRDFRVPILAWGLGLALLFYGVYSVVTTQITDLAELGKLAETFRFFGEPIEVGTPNGYITWRYMGLIPLLLAIWGVLVGSRLGRGAEERGALDILLATPRSRVRVLGEGIAAFVAALAIIALLIGLGIIGGLAAAGLPVTVGGALLAGLNAALVALIAGMLALVLAQLLTTARAAAGAAYGLVMLAWLIDGIGRVGPDLAWVGRLSPYHLYSLSKPLIASHGANVGAILGLLAIAAALGAASLPLFARRDLGGSAWPWALRGRRETGAQALARALPAPSLRGIGPRFLRANLPAVAWWLLGLGAFSFMITGVTRSTKDEIIAALNGSGLAQQLFNGLAGGTDAGFLSALLFAFLPVLLAFYALTQAANWAGDLHAGRLELILATPQPRWRVFLEAWGAVLVPLIVGPLATWLIVLVTIRGFGLDVAGGRLFAAFLGFLPFELLIAALVYLFAGHLASGTIIGLLGGVIGVSFLAELIGPALHLPAWVRSLSIFYQYGTPLTSDPNWGAWLILTASAAAIVGLGLLRFTRSDLQRAA